MKQGIALVHDRGSVHPVNITVKGCHYFLFKFAIWICDSTQECFTPDLRTVFYLGLEHPGMRSSDPFALCNNNRDSFRFNLPPLKTQEFHHIQGPFQPGFNDRQIQGSRLPTFKKEYGLSHSMDRMPDGLGDIFGVDNKGCSEDLCQFKGFMLP